MAVAVAGVGCVEVMLADDGGVSGLTDEDSTRGDPSGGDREPAVDQGTDAIDDVQASPDTDADGGSDSAADSSVNADDADGAPDAEDCEEGCSVAPDDCREAPGLCVDDRCVYGLRGLDAPCDDRDPCTEDDACDAQGDCGGVPLECGRDHTEGAFCEAGECQGWLCSTGWADCNDDLFFDGCETAVTTASDCGDCGVPCEAGENAVADCSNGVCVPTCEDPWENCDGDWTNGCEIPTGVANQCDIDGLNDVDGCWTAYCGSSANPDAHNFGTWFCFECSTCNSPAAGQCQWCGHPIGRWYPAASCACGAYEDNVCTL